MHKNALLRQDFIELHNEMEKEVKKHKYTKKAVTEEASLTGTEFQSLLYKSNAMNQLATDLASVEDGLP
jgi:transcriptional regulator with GAF, ATPase, and Fis domain